MAGRKKVQPLETTFELEPKIKELPTYGDVFIIGTKKAKHLETGKMYKVNHVLAKTLINSGAATLK